MLKRIFTVLLCSSVLFGCSASLQKEKESEGGEESTRTIHSDLEFKDSGEVVFNPDMGFYSVVKAIVTKDNITIKSSYKNRLENHNPICTDGVYPEDDELLNSAKFDQLLIEFDISSFSTRNDGTESLNGEKIHLPVEEIKDVLNHIKSAGKTALIRFSYDPDFGGEGKSRDVEPEDFVLILTHVEDICAAVKDYTQVLTGIQCGMIGPWGEMNFTTYSKKMKKSDFEKYNYDFDLGLDSTPDKNNEYIENGYLVLVMRKFTKELEANNCDVPLLVRQPKFIYDYIKRRNPDFIFDGETVPALFTPDFSKKEFYRLGLYNDGYLGSDGDSGTFTLDRTQETVFMEAFTNHTPYGGEMIGNYKLNSTDCGSMSEMFKNHLSVLNIGHKKSVFRELNKFKYNDEPAFKYLIKHIGYRYVLTGVVFEYPENLSEMDINLTFENNGFANLPYHRNKVMTVLFEKEGKIVFEKKDPNLVFDGKDKSFILNTSQLPEGSYTIYLRISDFDGSYPIQLANEVLWNPDLKATKIGTVSKINN